MLNHEMDAVVLVKGWKKGANWSFPRGKINKDEPDLDCAIREVYEETGFDIHKVGLVAKDEDVKYIEITMREQHMRLYVFRDVPVDTHFEPRTRKEISKIDWYKLSDLPTLKKGRNQQEGKGDDLAKNANKFYMVAPFLNPLKKWIAQQKKLDKQKGSGQLQITDPSISQDPDEALMVPSAASTESNPKANEMERLLAGLRQSGQTSGTSGLPEMLEPFPPAAKTVTPLNQTLRPAQTALEPVAAQPSSKRPTIPMASGVDRQKSNALLALLKGENVAEDAQQPQTPMEQAIEHLVMPPSPKHHFPHTAQVRAPPVASPIGNVSIQNGPAIEQPKTLDQPTAILQTHRVYPSGGLPTKQPFPPSAVNVSVFQQPRQPQVANNRLAQSNRMVPAPYQRTGDPNSTQISQPSGFPSSIPAASKLPPPKLTSHSSALLNLFKSDRPAKAPSEIAALDSVAPRVSAPALHLHPSNTERGHMSGVDDVSPATEQGMQPKVGTAIIEMPGMINRIGSVFRTNGSEPNGPTIKSETDTSLMQENRPSNDPKVQAAMAALHLSHPTTSDSAGESANSRTMHQATLLDIFRKPSAQPAEASKGPKPSLEPPPTPFELSALPSPGHSREPSRVTQTPRVQPVGDLSHILPMSQAKRTKAVLAPRKSPVSATVDGPLNVPQFDMLVRQTGTKPNAIQNGTPEVLSKSPVRILSRPAHPQALSVQSTPNSPTKSDELTTAPPNTEASTLAAPVKNAPASQYQPQILRRPPHIQPPQYNSIVSPIEPLPSPKQPLSRANQSVGHKQSLLSLFNKPSPALTPAPVEPEALISPPAVKDVTQLAIPDAGQHDTSALPSAGLERSRVGSLASVAGEGSGSVKMSSERHTPRTTTTPLERSFLLSYLEGVARGEK